MLVQIAREVILYMNLNFILSNEERALTLFGHE